jgi:hypothetical protein
VVRWGMARGEEAWVWDKSVPGERCLLGNYGGSYYVIIVLYYVITVLYYVITYGVCFCADSVFWLRFLCHPMQAGSTVVDMKGNGGGLNPSLLSPLSELLNSLSLLLNSSNRDMRHGFGAETSASGDYAGEWHYGVRQGRGDI